MRNKILPGMLVIALVTLGVSLWKHGYQHGQIDSLTQEGQNLSRLLVLLRCDGDTVLVVDTLLTHEDSLSIAVAVMTDLIDSLPECFKQFYQTTPAWIDHSGPPLDSDAQPAREKE